ncbi:MAG: RagB/SusD family nutrient uptake outer membrane protein [Bacteroidia bacterium]|nr:RagB/SusD family nutrient uptake outer membrane protein [Bacteroidia bacterium]
MKKIIILLIFAGMSLVLPTSCLKEYLDKAPQQGLTEDQIFTKLDNFKLFFDAVYAGTKYVGTAWDDYNIKNAFPLYFGLWDQKYTFESVTDASDQGRYMEGQAWKSGNMSETIVNKMTYDAVRRPILESMFTIIRISNQALKNVSRIDDADDNAKNDLRGQAYFVRALGHFTLMNLWGPMPYLDKALGPDDEWDIPRLSKHECLTRIAQDFDSSYYFFNLAGKIRRDPPIGVPGHLDYTAYQMYRPNGMAALAYKARALLYRASPLNNEKGVTDWQEAAAASWQALQVALNQGGASLLTIANRKQNYFGATNTDESLWTFTYGTLTWNNGGFTNVTNCGFASLFNGVFGASTGSWSGVCPTQNFVDKYETSFGEPLNTAADQAAATAAGHYNEQDPYANRDPRLATDIITNQSPCQGWTSNKAQIYYSVAAGAVTYSELLQQNYLGITKTGYYLRKFWFDNSTKNQVSSIFSDPLFRLAELYLDYAEAANEAYGPNTPAPGATLTAVQAINAVRTRAGMPNVLAAYTGSTAAFRPRIKNERNVELSWEGHYYYDIHRWMDLQTIMSSTLIGMDIEKVTATPAYPIGFRHTRKPLSQDRQVVWKPQMYYLPFNNADNLKMTKFVPNPVW